MGTEGVVGKLREEKVRLELELRRVVKALEALEPVGHKAVQRTVNKGAFEELRKQIVAKEGEFCAKDFGNHSDATVHFILKELHSQDIIAHTRTEGKVKYYVVSERMKHVEIVEA